MTQTAIRLTTKVLPGKRIEFSAPELIEGEDVEIFVALPHAPLPSSLKGKEYIPALDFVDSLPPSTLTPEDWQRIDRELQEEKDSWDR